MPRGLVRSVGALAAAALIALSGALALPATAEAQTNVLVSNIGQAAESGSQTVTRRAQAFTTGSDMDGYTLSSIELDFDTARIAVTVSLHSTAMDGNSGIKVYDLSSPRIPTVGNPFSGPTAFAAPSGATLTAGTTYFVEIQSADNVFVAVLTTASTTEDAGAAMDWSIADVRSTYSAGTWGDTAGPIKIRVNGNANPPTLSSAEVRSNGTTVHLNLSKNLHGLPTIFPDTIVDAFTLTVDGVENEIQNITATLANEAAMTLSSTIYQGQTVVVSYDQSAAGGDAPRGQRR